ncbi:hypothetical protein EHQ58_02675 [Leptospira ognonensis]|uniref:Lipoprotein n=1 Tax=Leptospira ognonensis TaxID=2484945 RepID=A0A4R9K8V1_9LEPT|nr:hypothetical protein [Leptospira ognonensis]TGL62127.1 hypothetical protein EHQ58_02675 [Leptospira ognonensis]
MILKCTQFALILFLFSCSSVEFIPEPEYTVYHSNFRKKSWEEVEILRERPTKPFQILGEIKVRNQSEEPWQNVENLLKKEMWEKKMDGVWLTERNHQKVDGFSLETADSRGHTTSSYSDQNTMRVWKGYAFRYK